MTKFDTVVSPVHEDGKIVENTARNRMNAIGTDTAIMEGTEQEHSVLRPAIVFEILVSLTCVFVVYIWVVFNCKFTFPGLAG